MILLDGRLRVDALLADSTRERNRIPLQLGRIHVHHLIKLGLFIVILLIQFNLHELLLLL